MHFCGDTLLGLDAGSRRHGSGVLVVHVDEALRVEVLLDVLDLACVAAFRTRDLTQLLHLLMMTQWATKINAYSIARRIFCVLTATVRRFDSLEMLKNVRTTCIRRTGMVKVKLVVYMYTHTQYFRKYKEFYRI